MLPNIVLNKNKINDVVDWEKNITIDAKYITKNKNTRANIRSLDPSKVQNKFMVQLGTGTKDSFKILFGISTYGGHQSERSDLNLEIDNDVAETFLNLDEFIVDTVTRRKSEFFDTERSDASIRASYYGCVKQDKEGKYNPNLKCKITLGSNEDMSTKVFEWVNAGDSSVEGKNSNDSSLVGVDDEACIRNLIQPKTQCMCIIQVQSLWFKTDNWGVSVEARLLGVFPQPQELQFFMPQSFAPTTFSAADEEKLQALEENLVGASC